MGVASLEVVKFCCMTVDQIESVTDDEEAHGVLARYTSQCRCVIGGVFVVIIFVTLSGFERVRVRRKV